MVWQEGGVESVTNTRSMLAGSVNEVLQRAGISLSVRSAIADLIRSVGTEEEPQTYRRGPHLLVHKELMQSWVDRAHQAELELVEARRLHDSTLQHLMDAQQVIDDAHEQLDRAGLNVSKDEQLARKVEASREMCQRLTQDLQVECGKSQVLARQIATYKPEQEL